MLILIFAALSLSNPPQSSLPKITPPERVASADISAGITTIYGRLPYPLGTPLEIEGTVEEHRHPPLKPTQLLFPGVEKDSIYYTLSVYKVNGVILPSPVSIPFDNPVKGFAWLASNTRALDELVRDLQRPGRVAYDPLFDTVSEVEPLTAEEAAHFRANYVGSKHRLVGYETGRFQGLPQDVPDEFSSHRWTFVGGSTPYRFSTYFEVMGEGAFPFQDEAAEVGLTDVEKQRYFEFIKAKWDLFATRPYGLEYFEHVFERLRETRWMNLSWFVGWETLLDKGLTEDDPNEKREMDRQLTERFGFARIGTDPAR